MITQHAVGYSSYTGNFYVVKKDSPEEMFDGFDKNHKPVYKQWGRLHETEDTARLQASMLDDYYRDQR